MSCAMVSDLAIVVVFFFKQKTAYEMRISDWSSDVCSSDLSAPGKGPKIDIALDPLEGTTITAKAGPNALAVLAIAEKGGLLNAPDVYKIGRASCRERVCQYV